MRSTREMMRIVLAAVGLIGATAGTATEAGKSTEFRSAPMLSVPDNGRVAASTVPTANREQPPTPALIIYAAATPRPLAANRSPDMIVSGRVFPAAPGQESVRLADLPWAMESRTGRLTTAIAVGLKDAVALRAGLSIEGLASPLRVRFTSSSGDSDRVLDDPVIVAAGKVAQVWSTTLAGPLIVVELSQAGGQAIPSSAMLRVEHIVEVLDVGGPAGDLRSSKSGREAARKTAGACFRDAVCESSPETDPLARAVVLLDIAKADGAYYCSGSLINDVAGSGRARVLTAGHCLEDALSVTAYFNYRSVVCDGPSPSLLDLPRTSYGAQSLRNPDLDYALLVFDEQAPPGSSLLGWSTRPLALGDELLNINHAGGQTQSLLRARVAALRENIASAGRTYALPRYDAANPSTGTRAGASGSAYVGRSADGRWAVIRGLHSFGITEASQATCPADGTKFSDNGNGAEFGQIYPGISSELEAPPVAAPTVVLSVNPTSVVAGASATLTWTASNAVGCEASGGWSGARATVGSVATGPLGATTTFALTCSGPGGSAAASATVTVAAAQDREGDARAVGGLGYALLATGQLRIDVTRIENTSATGRTGELRATTCVTSTTDSPACQTLWQVTRPGLQGGEVLEPLSITETYIVPPPGTYYIRFILEEIEQGGPRRFLLAHSATAETWVAPPQRVCLKYKKGKCKKWGTR